MKGEMGACSRTYPNMLFTVHTRGSIGTHLLLVDTLPFNRDIRQTKTTPSLGACSHTNTGLCRIFK